MTDRVAYKILTAAEEARMRHDGHFAGSATDRASGFIHLSMADQVAGTLAKHFAGVDDLVLLAIDLDALGGAVRFEPSRGGALFPHLYGTLTPAAVLSTGPVRRLADGSVSLPDEARCRSHGET